MRGDAQPNGTTHSTGSQLLTADTARCTPERANDTWQPTDPSSQATVPGTQTNQLRPYMLAAQAPEYNITTGCGSLHQLAAKVSAN
jgi:hypothetical protein